MVRRFQRGRSFLLLGLIAYVPLLATRPGLINADTKQMLYLDPARLVRNAPFLWDSTTGMGNVTHQNIGYLFPSGPFFWAGQLLGLPDWVTQRLWMGSILFAAGAGMIFLWRTLGLHNPWAGMIAALAYQLSPFSLGYVTGTSVLLLPWAGLPTMIALTIRASRRGGWRHPALLALVVTTVGAVNASSLFYVAIGVVLWFPCAVWATKEIDLRQAISTAARIGVLVVTTQLWWIMALLVGGRYGLPILNLTETVDQVSLTSSAPEILRGLGYWLFYVRDNGVLWWPFSQRYTVMPVVLGLSLLLPLIALIAGTVVRWRHRFFVATLILVGTVVAVGTFPSHDPSLAARAYRSASASSDLILSMRNTQRATPLVILGMALLLGTGLSALSARKPSLERFLAIGLGLLIAANFSPLWTQDLLSDTLHRPEQLPKYWNQAANAIDAKSNDDKSVETRVLELPGSDFAQYRWGNTLDPVTPGMTDRPSVSRELVPKGSAGTVSLLNALDRRMQEGTLEPSGIAPIARLMNAGDVLAKFDLAYERYRTPRPWLAWALFSPPPEGLGDSQDFGPSNPPNRATPSLPLIDEITLATEVGAEEPPRLALFPVRDSVPIIHTQPLNRSQTIEGDGEGLVELAEAGLLDPNASVLYAGSLASDAQLQSIARQPGNDLILTDTNRRRAQRWFGIRENSGYTEYPGELPLRTDPTSARIPLFPNETDDQRTVVIPSGGIRARATSYGDPLRLLAHQRPSLALDADPSTAWITGGFSNVVGERIVITLDRPLTSNHLTLLQPQGARDRYITRARLRFDGAETMDVTLTNDSHNSPGQRIDLQGRTFGELSIEVLDDGLPRDASYNGLDGVGFAEIAIEGAEPLEESTRLPISLLNSVKNDIEHRLAIVLGRLRSNAAEPVLRDTEDAMSRTFKLTSDRRFTFSGTARLSAHASDATIDRIVATPATFGTTAIATSSSRLPGDLPSRASSAIDANPATKWSPGFLAQAGHWIRVEMNSHKTIDRLDLQIVRDGRHSVPTKLRLDGDNGQTREVVIPMQSGALSPLNIPTLIPVTFGPLNTRSLTVTVTEVAAATTNDWYTQGPIEMPVGIAELGIPGLSVEPPATSLASECRDDLITVDGDPLPVRISGSTSDALARDELAIEGCDGPIAFTKGSHDIKTVPGRLSGIDIDRIVMLSGRGGEAETTDEWKRSSQLLPTSKEVSHLKVTTHSHTKRTVRIAPGKAESFWLVLGESHSDGWVARSKAIEQSEARLIDGFANGWLVKVPSSGKPFDVVLEWTPQRSIWRAIVASLIGVGICLAIIAWSFLRERRTRNAINQLELSRSQPVLCVRWQGHSPTKRAVAITATALGCTGVLVAKPIVGVAVIAFVIVGLSLPRSLIPLSLATFGAFGLSAAFIGGRQIIRGYPTDSFWPGLFGAVHWLAIASVLFLFAHACIERLRREQPND